MRGLRTVVPGSTLVVSVIGIGSLSHSSCRVATYLVGDGQRVLPLSFTGTMDQTVTRPKRRRGRYPQTRIARARIRLRRLYHGHSRKALNFQMGVLVVDLAIIVLFIVAPVLRETPAYLAVDYLVAAILGLDIAARTFAAREPWRRLRQPFVLLDLFILVTLLFPLFFINLGFLRIVRLWSLSRSGILWRPLRRSRHKALETPARAILNLVAFLFLATGFVYTFFFRTGSGFTGYIDALYFTVTSVTTTGYGDITLEGPSGKLTAILIMIVGITLFVRLAQSVFQPHKVEFSCPDCGLSRHDPDAVHCKACGNLLNIPDEGLSG